MANVIEITIKATDNASQVIAKIENKIAGTARTLSGGVFDRVGSSVDKLVSKLGGIDQIAERMGKVGQKMTLGVTLPLGALAVAATKAASDLGETTNKVEVLFGKNAKAIEDWSKSAAKSIGQSRKTAMDGAATFAIFGKSAGLADENLVKFSKDNVQLASDLASFHNTSPEEAITAIGAAFRGETEPIRRYGILLDDASMRQEALRLGLIKTTKDALTPQQKVLAAQALIFKQTSDAQGDFARTSTGLANATRITNAQLQDTLATLGENLLPIANDLVGVANKILEAFNSLTPEQQRLILGFAGIAAAIGPVLTIGSKIIPMVKGIGEAVKFLGGAAAPLGLIVTGLVAIVTYLNQVGDAASKTSDELIAMSHSGDLFQQAAASTEILLHGQERLKAALDNTKESITKNADGYADYKASLEATAEAAGYQIDAQGNLIKVTYGLAGAQTTLIQSNYELTASELEAYRAAHARGGIIDTGMKELLRLAAEVQRLQVAQTETAVTTGGVTLAVKDQTSWWGKLEAQMKNNYAATHNMVVVQMDVEQAMNDLNIAIAGAVGKENKQYAESLAGLQQRLKDTSDELAALEEQQGRVDKTTVQHTMSANELAQAQVKLANAEAQLAKETDPAKQRELAASIAVQRDRLNEANTSVNTYIDNSKKIADLKSTYADINKEIAKNAKAHEDATNRIIYGYAEQQLAVGGFTEKEFKALDALAVKLGLKSKEDVAAFQEIRDAAKELAQDGSVDEFARNVVQASDTAQGAAGRFVESLYPVSQAMDNADIRAHNLAASLTELASKPYVVTVELHEQRPTPDPTRTYPLIGGAQHGADFVVPPNPRGGGGDYFPMMFAPGERVTATPAGKAAPGNMSIGAVNITVGGSNASTDDIYQAVYKGIADVFSEARA